MDDLGERRIDRHWWDETKSDLKSERNALRDEGPDAADHIEALEARVAELEAALQEEQAESLRQAEIARDALTKAERLEARVADYETRLTAVMLPDYKDWHENAKTEWPEVAAATITSLREQADFFREAFDRADSRVTELEAAARAVLHVATLPRTEETSGLEADALNQLEAALAAEKGEGTTVYDRAYDRAMEAEERGDEHE